MITCATVLIADNNEDYLEACSELLEQEGYRVLTASNPFDARQVLDGGDVDLAVLDLRLVNDLDEKDWSGLDLARETAASIPKLIVSEYSTPEAARQALRPASDGLPSAVDFVAKQLGWGALVTAVRWALKVPRGFAQGIDDLSTQISKDYEEARQQVKVNFWASLGAAVGGMLVLLAGTVLVLQQQLTIGVLGGIAGVVVEWFSVILLRREREAMARMDRYHAELLETRRLKTLLDASEELRTRKRQDSMKQKIISDASDRWLRSGAPLQGERRVVESGSATASRRREVQPNEKAKHPSRGE
jgi:CheY-like chemotaxis protein